MVQKQMSHHYYIIRILYKIAIITSYEDDDPATEVVWETTA
jgi:hypothetical protein